MHCFLYILKVETQCLYFFYPFNLNHHFYAFQDLNVDDGGVRQSEREIDIDKRSASG